MVYRKVSMIEIKEILLRIAKGQSKRGIRRDLCVHGLTINRYIEEAKCLGINPQDCEVSQITDNLCSAIARNTTTKAKELLYPRDIILLPVKDRIEAYLKDGITKAKIIKLLGRDGIAVSESSFLRFVKSHFSHLAKNITVRLPEKILQNMHRLTLEDWESYMMKLQKELGLPGHLLLPLHLAGLCLFSLHLNRTHMQ